MEVFHITEPSAPKIPIIISVPHCGTAFPDEIAKDYNPELAEAPDDTDWFVHQLYDFAPAMGITLIRAHYSRWVIDLNRDPKSLPLYTDGRIITGLCPTTDFHGNNIYVANEPDELEVERRLINYYYPYHQKVQTLLDQTIATFGKVLLWDAHSIRQYVPTINKEKFQDLILGSVYEQSAHPAIIKTALDGLGGKGFGLNHNHPFKGGQITRSFGKPERNQHALQLEMSKVLYMDDSETQFDVTRSDAIRKVLIPTLEQLSKTLQTL